MIVPAGIPVRRRRGTRRRPEAGMGARARPAEWGASGGIAASAGAATATGIAIGGPGSALEALAGPLPASGLRRPAPARAGSPRERAAHRTVPHRTVPHRTVVPGAVGIATDIARRSDRAAADDGSPAGRTALTRPSGLAARPVGPPRTT